MKTAVDPRTVWWIFREPQTRLIKWVLALLRGRPYTIRLEPEGTGYHDWENHVIQANPQLFPKEQPEVQFRLTQGILAHEAGHAWFTSAWPGQRESRLQEMCNFLEDQRIENAICVLYPGIAPAIRLLGDHMLADQKRLPRLSAREQAYLCCLIWRWAYNRIDESRLFDRLGICKEAQQLWGRVKPLVEQAWTAEDTHQVINLSHRVLELLGIDPNETPARYIRSSAGNIPTSRTENALPFPAMPAESEQPGLGKGGSGEQSKRLLTDRYSEPAPYIDLEDRARPLACQLAEALQLPRPDVRLEPHESLGRYSFRQEVRTIDTPNLLVQGVDVSPRDLALYLLVDRSGSMNCLEDEVRLALMMIYLAATELEIPCGLAFFGAHEDNSHELVLEVTPPARQAQESVKALIAGFAGSTHFEFLDWGLARAEAALMAVTERNKVLVIVHDGEPVYDGRLGCDWKLSRAHLQRLERQGMTTIGVYLGDDSDLIGKLHVLFPRLIVCSNNDLPDKLGNLLRSLA